MKRSALKRVSLWVGLVLCVAIVPPTVVEGNGPSERRPWRAALGRGGRELPLASVGFSSLERGSGYLQPIENQLSAGTTNLLRTVRKRVRQVVRRLRYGAGSWSSWLGGLVLFLAVALVVPLLGRDNLRTFREHGFLAFARQLSLALAVYVRLLIDSRTPVVGKALVIFAVVYGAAPRDLFPDRPALLNYVDDLILLVLASRSFMMLCSQEIVEEHAAAAARAREESLRKKVGRRRPAKGSSHSSAATGAHH